MTGQNNHAKGIASISDWEELGLAKLLWKSGQGTFPEVISVVQTHCFDQLHVYLHVFGHPGTQFPQLVTPGTVIPMGHFLDSHTSGTYDFC